MSRRGSRSSHGRPGARVVLIGAVCLGLEMGVLAGPPGSLGYLVIVQKTGTGEGVVQGLDSTGQTAPGNWPWNLSDIDCGSQCVAVHAPNTMTFTYKLRATALPGSHLESWIGCTTFDVGSGDCTVTDATYATVTAVFTRDALGEPGLWYTTSPADSPTVAAWGTGALGDVPVPADYDGDGRADFAVWRPATGEWFILRSSDGVIVHQQWGTPGDVPVPADYDGDGRADLAVWRPGEPVKCGPGTRVCSEGTWFILRSSDGLPAITDWGSGALGDFPLPRDYDGDGRADLTVWRPGSDPIYEEPQGVWYIDRSSDGQQLVIQFGQRADVPVPADYGGTGQADLAVWRPSTGTWYILDAGAETLITAQWGAPGDVPAPADYDGDGRTDLAVWRPTSGEWYILNSRDGSVTYRQWGAAGDIPVPATLTGSGGADLVVYRP